MTSIYGRLGFDSTVASDVVQPLADTTLNHISHVPKLLNDWQTEDIANSNTGGYFQNPVSTVISNIWATSNSIIEITGLSTSNANAIYIAAIGLQTAANNFYHHTNRISGVEPVNTDTILLPHYESAIGVGKIIMYLVSQTDGISNNSPLIGSFTSLFTGNTLNTYYTTIQNYANTVANSVYTQTGNYYSNLISTQVSTISSELIEITTFMNTKNTADVNFYINSQAVLADYNSLKGFSNMGQTQEDLINNYIGTPKLLSRINS
jgi:hypothetical protein